MSVSLSPLLRAFQPLSGYPSCCCDTDIKVICTQTNVTRHAHQLTYIPIPSSKSRYRDDVVIHVNPGFVNIRSRSRVERSDLGVNASRIMKFLKALQKSNV